MQTPFRKFVEGIAHVSLQEILDHSKRVPSHERTADTHTVLLQLTHSHIRFARPVCERVQMLPPRWVTRHVHLKVRNALP